MPALKPPAIVAAGVATGLLMAAALIDPPAFAEPSANPPAKSSEHRGNDTGANPGAGPGADTGADGQPADDQSASNTATEGPSPKINASRALENGASVLRGLPAVTAEGPATFLEIAATVLSMAGLGE